MSPTNYQIHIPQKEALRVKVTQSTLQIRLEIQIFLSILSPGKYLHDCIHINFLLTKKSIFS